MSWIEKCTQRYIVSVIGSHLRDMLQATAEIMPKPTFSMKAIDQLAFELMQSLVPKESVEEYDVTALTTILRKQNNWFQNVQFKKVQEIRNMLSHKSPKYVSAGKGTGFQIALSGNFSLIKKLI